jgi:hypothetical protein
MTHTVETRHRAVWVNGPQGECLGRFGVYGIDVHRTFAEQVAGLGQCLDCTHARTGATDWRRFVTAMREFHGVDLSGMDVPEWVR